MRELDHTNMAVMRKYPYALKVESRQKTLVLYYETSEKIKRWLEMLSFIIETNRAKRNQRSRHRTLS